MDGWYHGDDNSRSSSSAGSLPQRLFDSYGISFCSADSSCAPGLPYKEEKDYLELEDSALMNSAVTQLQQQFYQIYMQMDMGQLFPEDFVQQLEFGEFFPPEQWQPSSSPSSLRSLSMGSPESSSLLFSNIGSSSSILDTSTTIATQQVAQPTTTVDGPPRQIAMPAIYGYNEIQFPTPTSEDIAITGAMLAIFSSGSSTSSTSSMLHQSLQQDQTHQSLVKCGSSFKPYNSALAPMFEPKKKSCSQKMIKKSISILRRIDLVRVGAPIQESWPSSHQLHHVISERKRREKLNGSFHALRLLLPPGSKKGKASLLCKTKDYLKTLKSQILELEEKNQMLEMHPLHTDESKDGVGSSIGRVDVQVIETFEPISGVRRINLKITVRVECDLIELVLHALEYLKEMRVIRLVSMDASTYLHQMNLFTWATAKFDIKATEWDEESFKEAMARAVYIATVTP